MTAGSRTGVIVRWSVRAQLTPSRPATRGTNGWTMREQGTRGLPSPGESDQKPLRPTACQQVTCTDKTPAIPAAGGTLAVPRSSRITAIVFDLGNVLVGWDPYLPLADRMSKSEWQEFTQASDFAALNALADSGVPLHEVVRRAAQKNPRHGELVAQYYERFNDSLTGPIPGVADIIEELQTTKLRLLGLTNWSAETYHHVLESAPAVRALEAVVVSGREGIAKPDLRLFRRMVKAHDLVPQQTVFIDDTERNVEAATELGFVAIRFTEAAQLREDLRHAGALS